jgi:21S rRNA (GM2251-2'-O)-methyltransferase
VLKHANSLPRECGTRGKRSASKRVLRRVSIVVRGLASMRTSISMTGTRLATGDWSCRSWHRTVHKKKFLYISHLETTHFRRIIAHFRTLAFFAAMVQLCLLRTALLRSNLPKVPITLLSQQLRYKSLTASIERGKESDNFTGPQRDDRRGPRPDRSDFKPPYDKSKSSDFGESRPKRDFGDRESRPTRDFGESNDSRPQRGFGGRDYKKFDHKGGPSHFEKRGSRTPRDFGGSGDRSTRPRREFGDDRGPKPSFGGDRDSRPRREFGDDRGPKPSFGGDRESGDTPTRPRREFGDDRSPKLSFGGDRESRPRREFGNDRGPKPSFGGDRESRPPRDFNGSGHSKPAYGGSRESRPPRDFNGSRDSRPFGGSRGSGPSRDFNASKDSRQSRDFSKPGEDGPSKTSSGIELYPQSEYHQSPRPSKHYDTSRDSRSPREYNDSRLGGKSIGSREPPQKEWDPTAHAPRAERSGFKFSDTRMEDVSRTDYSLESLPYTTAASEFLYGHSSVLAAIKADRRKLYTLYVHTRGLNHEGITAMIARAKAVKLNVREVDDKYLRAMDKASSGRPHNGFILEASPLPQVPITELGPSSLDGHFSVSLDTQSAEDAAVNGTQTEYDYKSAGWRHPLLLYVDGVLDEGNLGAIARSAYFLGVDAIATPTRQSAPWSHIALKASAGAAEAIPIFTVASPPDFLGKSAREGWRIYASDAVPAEETKPVLTSPPSTAVTPDPEPEVKAESNVVYTFARSTRRMPYDHSPVATHPTILMMGAEGAGLRSSLLNLAHYKVGIRHGRETNEIGVDSLNVSVAASLLCYEMLQKKVPEKKKGELLF